MRGGASNSAMRGGVDFNGILLMFPYKYDNIIIIDNSNDMRGGGTSVSVRGRGAKRGGASVTIREGETYDNKATIVAILCNKFR